MKLVADSSAGGQPVRVLHVVSNMDRGGAETMLMNYYRRIDRDQLQFDFLAHAERPGHYDGEILSLGGRIFRIQSPGSAGPIRYVRTVTKLLERHGPFNAVHTHTDSSGTLAALAARLAGVRRRIVHSHNTAPRRQSPRATVGIEEAMLKLAIRATATDLCACGTAAAAYLFGPQAEAPSSRVQILPNAVDLVPFQHAWAQERLILRERHGIAAGASVMICVANFVPAKNHGFLLELLEILRAEDSRTVLLLVGDGPLRGEIESRATVLGVKEQVRLLGVRGDVPELLRASDVFVLPSIFEGLPLALIEAQAAGLPCLVSTNVTQEVDVGLELVRRLSLNTALSEWAAALRHLLLARPAFGSEQVLAAIREKGYDVTTNLGLLYRMYDVPGLRHRLN